MIVQLEVLKGTMSKANNLERHFAAGMMCVTNFKLERELGRFGVEFDD